MYQKCPVCEGRGQVPHNFYYNNESPSIINNCPDTCRTCNGRGIIEVPTSNMSIEDMALRTCFNCSNRQKGMIYPSNPPMVKCECDNTYHTQFDSCEKWSE